MIFYIFINDENYPNIQLCWIFGLTLRAGLEPTHLIINSDTHYRFCYRRLTRRPRAVNTARNPPPRLRVGGGGLASSVEKGTVHKNLSAEKGVEPFIITWS